MCYMIHALLKYQKCFARILQKKSKYVACSRTEKRMILDSNQTANEHSRAGLARSWLSAHSARTRCSTPSEHYIWSVRDGNRTPRLWIYECQPWRARIARYWRGMAADGASGIGVAGRHRGTKIKSVSPLRGERIRWSRA